MKKKTALPLIVIVLLVCLIAVFTTLKHTKKIKAVNVVVITLDTTRADKMGYAGYDKAQTPHLNSLARNGIWFSNAFSPVPITLPSHCTIFTGTIPLYHQVRNNGNYLLPGQIETLAEILKRHKYKTAAFISSFTLDARFGLNQGFDTYNDRLVGEENQVKTYSSERPANMVFEDFSKWFKQLDNTRFFCWIHFYDPHLPYSPPEPYKSQFPSSPYDGEIAFVDVYVGKIIDLLKEKDVFQKTLIVVVGDHGEAFGEHGEFGHQIFCYEENLRVPLIYLSSKDLKGGKEIKRKTNIVDVMPTILDYLNMRYPKDIQGISLLPVMKGKKFRERSYYIESVFPKEALGCAEVKGIIKDSYKYIDLPKSELYNLKNDPQEKNNLFFEQEKFAKTMKLSMTNIIERYKDIDFSSRRKISLLEAKKLESLGYVSERGKSEETLALPDPKDRVKSWSEYVQGNQLQNQGREEEAIESYKKAIESNPNFSWPFSRLASLYYWKGDVENAERIFAEGMRANPEDYILKIDYVNFLIFESQFDKAQEILEELKRTNPVDAGVQINHLLGRIFFLKQQYRETIPYYKAVLKIEPDNLVVKKILAFCLLRTNEAEEALNLYLELEKKDPDDFDLRMNIALVYGTLERYEKAKIYFEKALKKEPKPIVYFNYAAVMAKAGNFKEAIDLMQKFLELYPYEDERKENARNVIEQWKIYAE